MKLFLLIVIVALTTGGLIGYGVSESLHECPSQVIFTGASYTPPELGEGWLIPNGEGGLKTATKAEYEAYLERTYPAVVVKEEYK